MKAGGAKATAAEIAPASRAEWRAWLAANHATCTGVWFVRFHKSSPKLVVTYDDAVEEALCFGWIDSVTQARDAESSRIWFTERRPGGDWAASNKRRVERLLARGLMEPAGLAKIEAAKADGSWDRLDAIEAMEIPVDLEDAFARHRGSRARFDEFPVSARQALLYWIVTAKRPETRARRIDDTARYAREGIRADEVPRRDRMGKA